MKSVLISIKPKWCELIASGKKTVEVRKTKPKIETPFKVYIYETRAQCDRPILLDFGGLDFHGRGQVIGEFVCRNMTCMQADIDSQGEKHLYNTAFIENRMCLTDEELFNYIYDGKRNIGWAWGISDLVIYDKPKDLDDFMAFGKTHCDQKNCKKCLYMGIDGICDVKDIGQPMTRPPQSWCYCEEIAE